MCELFALSSRMPATVTLSLGVFAKRGGLTGPHKDGWGIAYYDDGDANLIRDTRQAGDSPWVKIVEGHAPASRTVISHIRQASRGGVCLANTQPFHRELGGVSHVFAHNGELKDIDALYDPAQARFRPLGDTDSEIAFCILMERMAALWLSGTATPARAERGKVFSGFAAEMAVLGPANFLYSDGECLFAHGNKRTQQDGHIGPPGLYTLSRTCPADRDILSSDGIAISGEGQQVQLFASVPLTEEGWRPLDEGEVVFVGNGEDCGLSAA